MNAGAGRGTLERFTALLDGDDPEAKAIGLVATAALLQGTFGRILVSRDLDGRKPFFSQGDVVTREHVQKAVALDRGSQDDIRKFFEQLSSKSSGALRLSWKRRRRASLSPGTEGEPKP